MAKLLKFLVILIVIVALLLGALTFYLLKVFDPNDYKAEIQQLVKEQTQLDLTIGGDLALSVFPWLGVAANQVAVNAGQEELVSVQEAQVFAKLRPLLSGKLVVDGVKLDTLKLNLVVDRNGKGNWEIETKAPPSSAAQPQPSSPAGASLAALSIGTVQIKNADISYRDLGSKTHHQLIGLELLVSNPGLQASFPLSADFKYLSAADTSTVPVHLTTRITIDLEGQQLSLDDLAADLGNMRLAGQVNATQIDTQPNVSGRLNITDFNPKEWAKLLDNPSLETLDLPIQLQLTADLDSAADRLQVEQLSINSALFKVTGKATATRISEAPEASGNLQLEAGNLQQLLAKTGNPIETQDPKALQRLATTFAFKATEQALNLRDLTLELDQTKFTGQLGINRFDRPEISFDLSGDAINFDRYTPPPSETEDAQTDAQTAEVNPLLLPVALLKELNVQGRLQLQQLIASGLTIEKLDFKTKAANGLIRLEQLSGNLYEGAFTAKGTIDARGDTVQMQFNKTLSNMQAGPVLKALADVDYISGKLNLNINGTALGNSLDQIKRNLNGTANFSVTDGILSNINLEQMVCQGIAQARQLQLAPSEQTDTRFNQFDGRMTIRNGVVNMDAINIGLNKLKARGNGNLNLPDEKLDFSIKTTLLGDLESKACEVHERYRDIEWPIRCMGSWNDDPSDLCGLDRRELQKLLGRLAEKELKRKATEKLEDKLKDKLGDGLGDQLKQILKF